MKSWKCEHQEPGHPLASQAAWIYVITTVPVMLPLWGVFKSSSSPDLFPGGIWREAKENSYGSRRSREKPDWQ